MNPFASAPQGLPSFRFTGYDFGWHILRYDRLAMVRSSYPSAQREETEAVLRGGGDSGNSPLLPGGTQVPGEDREL
jgi:hypothetical protein